MQLETKVKEEAGSQPRWSLPRGRIVLRALRHHAHQEYLIFIPSSGAVRAPVLVSVHGVSRNAHEQARALVPACDERGIVLVVPIFGVDSHKDYQRLGRGRDRADLLLNRCLGEAASLSGADVAQIRLFGFSGGAQFVHRYLMAHPDRVERAVLAAAGWYTFPDHRRRFPYGIRVGRSLRGVSFNPEKFLRVPIHVLVGSADVESKNLRRSARLDAQQGTTRVERAHRWVAAMREAADAYRMERQVTLTEVPDVDHSFQRFCRTGALVARAFRSLFDANAGRDVEPPRLNGQAPATAMAAPRPSEAAHAGRG